MNCKEVTDFLSEYLDGTLPLRQRLAFKLHLLLCRDCRGYLDSYTATIKLTRSLRQHEALQDISPIPIGLVQAILAAHRQDGS